MGEFPIPTILCVFFAIIRSVFGVRELLAVSPLLGSEDFYLRMKRAASKNPSEGPLRKHDSDVWEQFENEKILTPEQDFRAKNEICANVFSSSLFDSHEEDVLDLNLNSTKMDLQQRYSRMYADIYEFKVSVFGLEYVNPYVSREVIVKEEIIREYMFACLTRKRRSDYIFEYFLSPVYNVNESTHTSAPFLHARFIFSFDDANQLVVMAIAEEPAMNPTTKGLPQFVMSAGLDITLLYSLISDIVQVVKRSYDKKLETTDIMNLMKRYYKDFRQLGSGGVIPHTNQVYYDARSKIHDADDVITNSICNISTVRKIRLCTIILNSVEYWGKIRFYPNADNVEQNCEKKSVFARLSISGTEITYNEWLLGCKTTEVGSNETKTYYISRGAAPNSAIVFKRLEGSVDTYTGDVGLSGVGLITGEGKSRPITSIRSKWKFPV